MVMRKTVTVTTAQNVTIDGPASNLAVRNVTGGGYVSFRLDGTTAVSGADDNFVVPQIAGGKKVISRGQWPVTVSVIASASTVVHLEAIDDDE